MVWLDELSRFLPLVEPHVWLFVLILTRTSGLLMTSPLLGARDVPLRIRALISFAMAVLLLPVLMASPAAGRPATLIEAAIALGGELAIGAVLGLGVMILFAGLQVAGQLIGQLSGMSLGEVFDPTFDDSSHVMTQLMYYVTMATFVILGGHRRLVAALVETFAALPPGSGMPPDAAETLTTLLSHSFALGVRLAGPTTVALLLSIVILAIIGRTVPQLNVLLLGFSLNSLLALAVLALSLGSMVWTFQEEFDTTLEVISNQFARRPPG
jgi:flagellar biosynthetic protein FliR